MKSSTHLFAFLWWEWTILSVVFRDCWWISCFIGRTWKLKYFCSQDSRIPKSSKMISPSGYRATQTCHFYILLSIEVLGIVDQLVWEKDKKRRQQNTHLNVLLNLSSGHSLHFLILSPCFRTCNKVLEIFHMMMLCPLTSCSSVAFWGLLFVMENGDSSQIPTMACISAIDHLFSSSRDCQYLACCLK